MTDLQFRTWANRLITTVAGWPSCTEAGCCSRAAILLLLPFDRRNPMAETADALVSDFVEWIAA